MSVDKNKAMITFLSNCPTIQANPLFFNFADIENDVNQMLTSSDDISLDSTFVDGSVLKRYTFSIDSYKSVSYNPVIAGLDDENVDDFKAVQDILDWINAQGDNMVFPNFGDNCIIEKMVTLTARPDLVAVDTSMNPPTAVYRVSIQIDYIDTAKRLWN